MYERARPDYPSDALDHIVEALGLESGAHVVDVGAGTAESIPLDDGSADAVTAAQAFHWFDPERALPELKRVLRPRGGVALVWNVRDEKHPLHQAYAEAIKPYKGDDYPASRYPADELLASPLFTDVEKRTFPHVQLMDADGLAARAASVSFVARQPGTFEFPYVTKVFTGRSR